MEISNEIMLALIGVMLALFKLIEKLAAKVFPKTNGEAKTRALIHEVINIVGHTKTLTHEEHDWLKNLSDSHDRLNDEGLSVWCFPASIKKQIEAIRGDHEIIKKFLEIDTRTLGDIWGKIEKCLEKKND